MFKSVEHALRWAYTERQYRLCIKASSISRQYRAPRNRDDIALGRADNDLVTQLSDQERQLQAAQIINTVRGIKPAYLAEYLSVVYTGRKPSYGRIRGLVNHVSSFVESDRRVTKNAVALTVLKMLGRRGVEGRKCLRAQAKYQLSEEMSRVGVVARGELEREFREKGILGD